MMELTFNDVFIRSAVSRKFDIFGGSIVQANDGLILGILQHDGHPREIRRRFDAYNWIVHLQGGEREASFRVPNNDALVIGS